MKFLMDIHSMQSVRTPVNSALKQNGATARSFLVPFLAITINALNVSGKQWVSGLWWDFQVLLRCLKCLGKFWQIGVHEIPMRCT